jgi:co-chaperonin GroES (HSP10)
MKPRAVNKYILVREIKEQKETAGGLLLTESESTESAFVKAEVVSIGNLVEAVNVGETIYFGKGREHEQFIDGESLIVIREQEVVLVY